MCSLSIYWRALCAGSIELAKDVNKVQDSWLLALHDKCIRITLTTYSPKGSRELLDTAAWESGAACLR